MEKISSNEREEVIDVLFLILMVYLGISLIYQISLLQSTDANLREIGRLSLGLGFVSVLGMCLTMLSTSAGLMKIKNLKKDDFKNSMKDILVRDEDFSRDFGLIFLVALAFQLGFSFIYGSFTGFQLNAEFQWELNAFLLTINAGIGEELFFSLFLTGFLLSLSSKKWFIFLALITNLIGFGLVHMVVYKSNQEAVVFVLFMRALYFFVYLKTRRASIPMILHCFNNFLFIKSILFV